MLWNRPDFTDEEARSYREVFERFATEGDGTISTKDLMAVMRSLGQNPTEAEVQEHHILPFIPHPHTPTIHPMRTHLPTIPTDQFSKLRS